ncbi:STAS domain-containing protein [Kitasatospora sp. NPDC004799]|uniref:STAS domain-containing protein n=1 Tax=Kitasatospora sp. NPDC004799 TaxID=3154460 RepID=UPI0033B5F012
MDLRVSTRRMNGWTVIQAEGELDLLTAPRLRRRLTGALRDGPAPVLADLRGVTFCDASGLRALVAAHHAARRFSMRLPFVVAPNSRLLRVLRLTELDGMLELHSDVPAAMAGADPIGAATARAFNSTAN